MEKGISGIETAFSVSYGRGEPVIGILAEYDALSGLSGRGRMHGGEAAEGRWKRSWLRP